MAKPMQAATNRVDAGVNPAPHRLEEARATYAEALEQLYRDKSFMAAAAAQAAAIDLQDAEAHEKRT